MTSHPFDLVSLDAAGTTVDEGGLVRPGHQWRVVEIAHPGRAVGEVSWSSHQRYGSSKSFRCSTSPPIRPW